mgnify:CR=1 FL=1
MMKRSNLTAGLILSMGLLGSLACAFGDIRPNDPMDRQSSLEEQHKHYTDLVRWSQFNEAAGYLEPSERASLVATQKRCPMRDLSSASIASMPGSGRRGTMRM